MPVELLLKPGEKHAFKVQAFNSRGQAIELTDAKKKDLKFTLNGPGTIDAKGEYTAPSGSAPSATIVTAALGDVTGQARLRVIPPLPWKFDFNDTPLTANPANPSGPQEGEAPLTWIGARYRHKVRELDGDKVMAKITTIPKGTRSQSWMGPDDMHDYTIQADLRGQHKAQSMLTASNNSASNETPSAQAINPSSAENPGARIARHGCHRPALHVGLDGQQPAVANSLLAAASGAAVFENHSVPLARGQMVHDEVLGQHRRGQSHAARQSLAARRKRAGKVDD